jgi:hypothetical protein
VQDGDAEQEAAVSSAIYRHVVASLSVSLVAPGVLLVAQSQHPVSHRALSLMRIYECRLCGPLQLYQQPFGIMELAMGIGFIY